MALPTSRRSNRIARLTQSFIRSMTRECERVGGINLGQGVCDLPTPPAILAASVQAIEEDISTYSKYEGVDALRERIAAKAASFNGLVNVDADTDITVSIGSTGAFNCVLQGLFNPGDRIIVFEPYYGYHVNTMVTAGIEPTFVTLPPPDWPLTRDNLESMIDERVRGILVNTPANPSGKVFSRTELQVIAELCVKHDLLAITDEIYEYITYEAPHISLASLPGMWERTVTISGFSKTFSITGWRLGYAIAPPHLSEAIGLVNDLLYICAPTPLQVGLAHGMATLEHTYYRQMAESYRSKRDLICSTLSDIGLTPCVPNGSYYVLADITPLGLSDDREAAMHILEEVGVASVPGRSFFASDTGRGLVRFCFAKAHGVLEEACARLQGLTLED
ncbi:MAG: aminotransferase class I/II-fold pyridoxal phosphate-dependent enzyme [Lentisphaerae bacterium]|mgnify:CR=1 FL=1|jgi:aminotransferase|nr:aminotransferase class I/II-fold pyridoxal phosphate-dependent enzyme [Lentisphaerota bacterium]MBT4821384.1 aminotransferase class I/II-fold pyridoxal phosphate-dependent enzyme [Lentisphaerota bacterium]MBT5610336.1 aminotransferase class I/II-fold pyridoxal phosphate-dependent enzyme [Lentisphaerota bacterium]MBT7056164.1 aminotransferase class I/II-fold pyridoxal phosphate-dependent enzyme [Lentisphaerota bacterium]MBT7841914.1 aminotransferase class I/II-fold pyridoxal phosphate-depende